MEIHCYFNLGQPRRSSTSYAAGVITTIKKEMNPTSGEKTKTEAYAVIRSGLSVPKCEVLTLHTSSGVFAKSRSRLSPHCHERTG